jgi:hypothetical protein
METRYLSDSWNEMVEALEGSLGFDHHALLPLAALNEAFSKIEASVTRIEAGAISY